MRYQWIEKAAPSDCVNSLAGALGVSRLVARLLVNRGFTDPSRARAFLNPDLSGLHDPFLMKGMKSAIGRLLGGIEKREKILIYGDYDVDGITATVCLRRGLEMLGGQVGYYIPKRLEEGYGVKGEVLERFFRDGYRLAITVDSGIRAFEAARTARRLGMDLIITDHHIPDETLPDAFAILNPKQKGCPYPFKDLAAVGVAFKVVQALFQEKQRSQQIADFLKVVAIGTVADMVPMAGENRVIVKFGLEGLAKASNKGLKALLAGAGVAPPVTDHDIGFKLAPRINAFTRMGGGSEVVDLFSSRSDSEAAAIVEKMDQSNRERRATEEGVLAEIEDQLAADPGILARNILFVCGLRWHRGVIGNVAARLVERFHKPTLVLSLDDTKCQGSGRSVAGFNLLNVLDSCREFFLNYGGHAQAVGFTLDPAAANSLGVGELVDRLELFVSGRDDLSSELPRLEIEAELALEEIGDELLANINSLAPFGIGNPVPTFATRRAVLTQDPLVLKEKHLKLFLDSATGSRQAVWWKNGSVAGKIRAGSTVDVAYTLTRESYRGTVNVLLTVRDLGLAES